MSTEQVKQDIARCLPRAQALFQQLANAPHPADYIRAYQDAFQDASAEDLWAAVLLPTKIAQVYIAEELSGSQAFSEISFTYALRAAFGVMPQQTIVNMPLDYITSVTQKSASDVTAFLEKAGFEVKDGHVTGHESMAKGFVDQPGPKRPGKPPRP